MSWYYDPEIMAWRHSKGLIITQEYIYQFKDNQNALQLEVMQTVGEELPDDAFPVKYVDPLALPRMIIAVAEVKKKLASVDDIREPYDS